MRYCIVHNPLLLQPPGHWLTFIYRTHEHRAVGSSGIGLTGSRGLSLFRVAVPSPVVFIVPQTFQFVNTFFNLFSQDGGCALTIICGSLSALDVGCSLTPTHPVIIDYHIFCGLSRGFLNFFCSVGRFCFTSPNYALRRGCSLLSAP